MGCHRSLYSEGCSGRPSPQVPLRSSPFGGSGGAQARAQPGQPGLGLSREAHRAGAMPPPAARRRPGAAEQPLPLPPAGRRTAFSSFFPLSLFFFLSPTPFHSCLINYLPSFSQIYQHLAFAWTHSQPQPLSPGEEQRQRDSFLKGLGRWKK